MSKATRYSAEVAEAGSLEKLRAVDIWIGEASYVDKGYGTQITRLALLRRPCGHRRSRRPLANNARTPIL